MDAFNELHLTLEALYERAKLLQEEIASQMSEQMNRNLMALSILTALLMPATLVSGIFGMNVAGLDVGGETVNNWIRALSRMQVVLAEFQHRHIFIKDLSRGLVDFPALIGNREVFLCWEADEDDIEFWHDLESGYTGRERLE